MDTCTAKTISNTGNYQITVPEATIRAFHITVKIHPCYNQPRVGRLKFRLETTSTVVWLYTGGVSLILPDVQFGTVSQDCVTYINM